MLWLISNVWVAICELSKGYISVIQMAVMRVLWMRVLCVEVGM